jgi:hypothetical protein
MAAAGSHAVSKQMNPAGLDAFAGKPVLDIDAAIQAAVVVIGDKLDLYKTMADTGLGGADHQGQSFRTPMCASGSTAIEKAQADGVLLIHSLPHLWKVLALLTSSYWSRS